MAYTKEQKNKASNIISLVCTSQLDISKLLNVSEAQILLLKKGRAGFKGEQLNLIREKFSALVSELYINDEGELLCDYFIKK